MKMSEADFADAIDLSHHLSEVSKNRVISPLKGLQKYFGKPGMLSLAGGQIYPSSSPAP
jgi:aromatic amino acid aminotransferase I